jgi:two-component system response regulator AlgR
MKDEGGLKVFIVDDEAPARKRMRELLVDCAAELPLAVSGEASRGKEALESLSSTPADVVLLDIRMPGMDGLEVARHLEKLTPPPAIIFTTAFDHYAVQAFEVNAIDYLLKPVRKERLLAALKKARSLDAARAQVLAGLSRRTHFSIVERGKVLLVPLDDVIYLRAELKYVTVKTRARDYLVEESLTHLEEEFGERFVRIHRNCLVARAQVEGFARVGEEGGEGHWVTLLKGLDEQLPVSRRQAHVIRELAK